MCYADVNYKKVNTWVSVNTNVFTCQHFTLLHIYVYLAFLNQWSTNEEMSGEQISCYEIAPRFVIVLNIYPNVDRLLEVFLRILKCSNLVLSVR